MKKILILCIVLSLIIISACSKKTEVQKDTSQEKPIKNQLDSLKPEMNLVGTINSDLNIHMNLRFRGNEVNGTYFYDKFKTSISLKGSINNIDNIIMSEYDAKGNVTGVFNGKFTSQSNIEGTWSKPDGSNKMPFSVFELNESVKSEKTKVNWAGEWLHTESNQFFSSLITIKNLTASSFKFSLDAHNGANLGNIEDETAKINGNRAVFEDKEYKFKITFILDENTLKVKTEGEGYFGAGVYVDGDYNQGIKGKTLTLKDVGVLENDSQEQAFKKLVGEKYERFRDAFQSMSEENDEDKVGAKVFSGWVRGIAPYFAAIIMYTPDGKFWAAVVDEEDIKYYTNTSDKLKLPKTIEKWREGISVLPISYMSK